MTNEAFFKKLEPFFIALAFDSTDDERDIFAEGLRRKLKQYDNQRIVDYGEFFISEITSCRKRAAV